MKCCWILSCLRGQCGCSNLLISAAGMKSKRFCNAHVLQMAEWIIMAAQRTPEDTVALLPHLAQSVQSYAALYFIILAQFILLPFLWHPCLQFVNKAGHGCLTLHVAAWHDFAIIQGTYTWKLHVMHANACLSALTKAKKPRSVQSSIP